MGVRTLEDVKVDLERLMAVVLVSLKDWNSEQEAAYLRRSPANRRRLKRAIRDANAGRFAKTVTIDELEQHTTKKRKEGLVHARCLETTWHIGLRPTAGRSTASCD
jgi:PHD/YefM family antitoxin component YafN of YafNO toxin-antitoxin module